MRAPLTAAVAVATCVVLTACSTHRMQLESEAPPQGLPAHNAAAIATLTLSLLESVASRGDLRSSEALPPITEAATLTFQRTGSTRAFVIVKRYANAILRALVRRGSGSRFFGAATRTVPQAQIVAEFGLALADAYAATHNPRFRVGALAAAIAVTSSALGWIHSPNGVGVRFGPGNPGPNIAMTANAALLLKRAAALGRPDLLAKSQVALHTIYSSQAAVGRWYANVGGRLPMTLGEWGATLFDLSADGSKESLGITGAGVPGLYENSFGAGGQPLKNSQSEGQPTGVALALRTLATYGDTSLADKAFSKLVQLRRHDGTISLARSDDTVSQAYFALAFAQRLAGGTRSE